MTAFLSRLHGPGCQTAYEPVCLSQDLKPFGRSSARNESGLSGAPTECANPNTGPPFAKPGAELARFSRHVGTALALTLVSLGGYEKV